MHEIWFISKGNKVGKCCAEVCGTIVFDESINWYSIHSRVFGHMKEATKLKPRRLPFNAWSGDG